MDKCFLEGLREQLRLDGQDDQGESILHVQELLSSSGRGSHQDLRKITSLEEGCESLGNDIDRRSVNLVEGVSAPTQDLATVQQQEGDEDNSDELVISSTKNAHLLKGAWSYILRLDECMRLHLRNAAAYHQFYFECNEYGKSMSVHFPRLFALFEKEKSEDPVAGGEKLLKRVKDVAFALSFFRGKVMELNNKGGLIVPVNKRTDGKADGIPVMALCAYKDKQIEFKQGDDLILVRNKEAQIWKVKNGAGQSSDVPAPVILIPPPDHNAADAAFRLQLQLLGHWLNGVKVLGKFILFYIVKILSLWKAQKADTLKTLPPAKKNEIKALLGNVSEVFRSIWAECPGYEKAGKDGAHIMELFVQGGSGREIADDGQETEIGEVSITMQGLVDTYEKLLEEWRRLAMQTQMAKMPDQLLMVKGWDDYTLTSFDDLMAKWRRFLAGGDSSWWDEFSSWMEEWEETLRRKGDDKIEPQIEKATFSREESVLEEASLDVLAESESAESEGVTTSEQEMETKYVILGAIDPWTGEELDYATAIRKGILNVQMGFYYDTRRHNRKPMSEAVNEGLVLLTVQNVVKKKERTTSYGVITITTTKESRPYTIKWVMDTKTDKKISLKKAEELGIINVRGNTFLDKDTNNTMPISDAIEVGLIEVEYEGGAVDSGAETETRSYTVSGVVDRKKGIKLTYNEAVAAGLVNAAQGTYFDTLTGEWIFLGDAIAKAYIKARKVDNTKFNLLDVDPSNHIIASKLVHLKSRIKALTAFKNLKNKV